MYWRAACGRKVEEHEHLQALLETGEGVCETWCLRLNIGMLDVCLLRLESGHLTIRVRRVLGSVHWRADREENTGRLAVVLMKARCLEPVLFLRRPLQLLLCVDSRGLISDVSAFRAGVLEDPRV